MMSARIHPGLSAGLYDAHALRLSPSPWMMIYSSSNELSLLSPKYAFLYKMIRSADGYKAKHVTSR